MTEVESQPGNILYCSGCDALLRRAVSLPCCEAPCCESCIQGRTQCPLCDRAVPETIRHSLQLRRIANAVPTRCPNEGCRDVMRQDELAAHRAGRCPFEVVDCVSLADGCTVSLPRQDMREHQTSACLYRSVSCPNRCGEVVQSRELDRHISVDCPKTLVDCQNRCGQHCERGLLGEHASICPLRPRCCPYRVYGCLVRGNMTDAQLQAHVDCSIHAHLLLLEAYARSQNAAMRDIHSLEQAPRHCWDSSYTQCVAKWPAQAATISALCLHKSWVVTGCERGEFVALDMQSGAQVCSRRHGAPIRAMAAGGDHRLYSGHTDLSVSVWISGAEPLEEMSVTVRLHPARRSPAGIVAMAALTIPAAVAGRGTRIDEQATAEVLAVVLDSRLLLLDGATLQQLCAVEATGASLATSLCVVGGRYAFVGSASGQLHCVDLHRPLRSVLVANCFPMDEAVTALCAAPNLETVPGSIAVVCGGTAGTVSWLLIPQSEDGSVGVCESPSRVCDAHKGRVHVLCAVDGKHVASGGADECWRLWAASNPSGPPVTDFPSSMYCGAVAKGVLFAAGAQGVVKLWTGTTLRFAM